MTKTRSYETLDVHNTDRLRVEARRYADGTVTVWWTDGPRSDEQTHATAAEAIDEVRAARADHEAQEDDDLRYDRAERLAADVRAWLAARGIDPKDEDADLGGLASHLWNTERHGPIGTPEDDDVADDVAVRAFGLLRGTVKPS